jgi:hypothetical protein
MLQKRAAATLGCLADKLGSVDATPPEFIKGEYEIKALYGKFASEDKQNEIHMLVYGPDRRTAVLYESYLTDVRGSTSVFIGQWATFKDVSGNLSPDVLPGGLATHQRILKLVQKIQQEDSLLIPHGQAEASTRSCVWQP